MIDRHERLKNDVAAYALGSLEEAARPRVEAHLTECAECRQLLEEYAAVVRILPRALPAEGPSSAVRDRLLSRVRERGRPSMDFSGERPVAASAQASLTGERSDRKPPISFMAYVRRHRAIMGSVAAAAAVLVLAIGIGIGASNNGHSSPKQRAERASQQTVASERSAIAAAARPSATAVGTATGGAGGQASGALSPPASATSAAAGADQPAAASAARPAAPAVASSPGGANAAQAPRVEVKPSIGAASQTFVFMGTGYPPSQPVTAFFVSPSGERFPPAGAAGDYEVGTDASGSFSVSFIPTSAPVRGLAGRWEAHFRNGAGEQVVTFIVE